MSLSQGLRDADIHFEADVEPHLQEVGLAAVRCEYRPSSQWLVVTPRPHQHPLASAHSQGSR